ncbi:MAG: uracil-DNA glycosylase [Candidatus Sulfobium sp.]|jgi:uracil-DNA glycosylase family 4
MDAGKGKRSIIEDLKSMLEFYEAMGLEKLPIELRDPPGEAGFVPPGKGKSFVSSRKREAASSRNSGGQTQQAAEKAGLLKALRDELGDCVRCKLSGERKNIVFGDGNPGAALMFIGEGPGREEDIQGLPFVGDAGMLLSKLIEKMGLKRKDVYIANIVKCRPPGNRDPEEDEVATCRQFIDAQIEIIKPRVIMTLGRIALQTLLENPRLKISAARGNFTDYRGIPVMPTFHPAYLLRNPRDKWLTWADAQKVMERLHIG